MSFFCNVYTVKFMDRISKNDEVAKQAFVAAETRKAAAQGEEYKYKESGRFRIEYLVPHACSGWPVEIDVVMPQRLVASVAVEVCPSTPEPYVRQQATKLLTKGERELHIVKAEVLEQVNYVMGLYPLFESVWPVEAKDFGRFVFVRKRRATLRENLRYLRISSNGFAGIGLPALASFNTLRRWVAAKRRS